MPEFIRGNDDGPYRVDDTYTVCRVRVRRADAVDETERLHLHPGYHVIRGPDGSKFLRNIPDNIAFTNINQGDWPKCCPAERARATAAPEGPPQRLPTDGTRVTEYIHGHQDGKKRRNEHYTICRLGVPLRMLAREVREGLHPDYEVVTFKAGQFHIRRKDGTEPTWRCGMVCAI
jgi:hypothetical protein